MSTPQCRLQIALFHHGGLGSFHWVLVPSSSAPTGIVKVYQMDQDPHNPEIWSPNHTATDLMHPDDQFASKCVGCVLLPPVNAPLQDVVDYILQDGLTDESHSGATWILVIVEGLRESGLLVLSGLETQLAMRRRILARGSQLQAGMGYIEEGIPMIDL
ncbi:hypothetical protein BV25DRAFT_1992779 [Artomyces pyxidatus]|uniref:Uncharacterized protein n=1 Tax=Artomyces pyxidatus TaxID=48021 RepID=A0ACB8SY06_9AGAM|nr:hypothetical protein BV25DRAFT_1992779 [Artomyces pyxidatus]